MDHLKEPKYGAEYRYSHPGFTNPSVQEGLESLLFAKVQGFGTHLHVCDLGCGNGRFAGKLLRGGHQVVGVDRSISGIELARSTYGGADFICADIDDSLSGIMSQKHEFDVVVSTDVVEHLFRPSILVDVAFRLLRPGGHIVLCTPYHGYFKNVAIAALGKWDSHHTVDWDGGHIKFFSVRTLDALVTRAGFQDVAFSFFGRVPLLWKNMICVAKKPEPRP